MANTLRVSTKIRCNTCGCTMKRTKSIEVVSADKGAAIKEANEKIAAWQETLKGQNCATCKSIIEAVAA